ncbi:hypothetical protein [Telmatospirillum siberiense]|uniref:NrfJ n=1 Tax=Telmatospirillum siberiense TaxID=382514 RepID=A0A2N3PVV3_9PROT|nr:hypothetical protein [Telmatospirillum siberiense]PKU24521.1 hypothetical protein CWS72_10480 [Telmatospirillum siberiense]
MRLPFLVALLTLSPMAVAVAQMPTGQSPMQMPAGHPPIGQNVPSGPTHTGTVLETIPASSYVYIHVNGDAGDQWLAAPAVDLKKGTAIRWAEGMLMANYHSKTLDRTFEKVYFIGGVEVVAAK